ncbi:MAG: acetyl-CoA carboxylase carboxyltransferase subunit beta [Rhodothermaceae bacterium]|nr:acetyl-CoA carboxylase carboxyltransferase subunit beta [Rhodothermaceae bacterium]MXZ18696.1 acetyl-CoA carboxylase carboxyltransferase subunit beta [Rhodothermaceae bacterium]MXZ56997.1 acetyl-CoA carboxylase carboxyltransferase subunit beta [Rhodothermaceae bacterium]MYB90732.1 acetyl-CoA carboxylase carboxyltransferase subunit beta [Rhodothermaceae bacterium]MYD68711.1 acetyl-CoA carboxylase carboxyltransferase subunit beta [Rhodothermaceae bacterium]
MSWFKRTKKGILTSRSGQHEMPAGQWQKCPGCAAVNPVRALNGNLNICPKCDYHGRLGSSEYFALLLDDGSCQLQDQEIISTDPLEFTDRKHYSDRLESTRKKSGLPDAVQAAIGQMDRHTVSIAAMDFKFIGGSMGSVVGEVIARSIRRGVEQNIPVIVIAQSGGARMMEGALSLMQMAKTSAHLARLHEKGIPYISVLTNPTTGGVTASFAMLGDINIAEPGALIGFAGPRVIRETIGQDLPKGFQSSEFLKDHGFVDMVVDRRKLRTTLIHLLNLFQEESSTSKTDGD